MPDDLRLRWSTVHRTADVSPDGLYRYDLERRWGDGPLVLWIMLNPSTGDAARDDATLRRCQGYTRAWDMDGIAVVNLFAWRTTTPVDLLDAPDPVGPRNADAVRARLDDPAVGKVVAAWGGWWSNLTAARRPARLPVETLAADASRSLFCLGRSPRTGGPIHPLYVPRGAHLTPFTAAAPKGPVAAC